ncbi:Na+/H+ antiporter NhaD/arsenite permease-like protein [Ereboglobus sp. PH5-5]|uniref:sodium:proton antiporter n=1 Tax=Ereboglobus sp. PH5-5 TaxID=2940529 RepID=UPI0024052135|nr:sodium:proton antiporter [Ereboglobus sp. PH5-5]MDF9831950.1 Na+/H+ antiporter NhaD/arsenite permease-like protein [Ereboglobus sp. PH5-5]
MIVELFASSTAGVEIPLWLIAPFALLLLLIAVMPLTPHGIKAFWEKYYPVISIGLGLLVAAYYVAFMPNGGTSVVHTAHEYFSFICLIGSLFVVAGGIHINVNGESSPFENVIFLAFAALLSNFIGTTGASMVLIRPWMRMNHRRLNPYHIVFFIFIVSNVGGALTPIGDPPLFLGFLRGVPFFWLVGQVVVEWLCTLGLLMLVFYIVDRRYFKKIPAEMQAELKQRDEWRFSGMFNVAFLLMIISGVFLPTWLRNLGIMENPENYLVGEIVMIAAAVLSYVITPKKIHAENVFNFGPIKEVGFLFAGIFMTMMPALMYLSQHGESFGFVHAWQYYFTTGGLSSVLDNAPTYASFFELAKASAAAAEPAAFAAVGDDVKAATHLLLEHKPHLVTAVSLGAVFFGAMTYIGNGPNFMVKSIAESSGVKMPTFFGYILKYSLPILLPILILGGYIFL